MTCCLLFLVTTSRDNKFTTIKHAPIKTTSHLKQSLLHFMQLYSRVGFVTQTILVDRQVKHLKGQLSNVVVNTTASSKHVGYMCLHMIKQWARATVLGPPYQHMPEQILVKFINFVVLWLNLFLSKSGISKPRSPQEIVIRQTLNYIKYCKAQFGACCKFFIDPTPSNMLVP